VALTDGAESLPQHMITAFPHATLILDSIHASEYLWATATALLGETSPLRTPWVAAKLDLLLAGQVATVITHRTAEATRATWTDTQRTAIQRTIGQYARNQAYMRYDAYLAHGWPIGSAIRSVASSAPMPAITLARVSLVVMETQGPSDSAITAPPDPYHTRSTAQLRGVGKVRNTGKRDNAETSEVIPLRARVYSSKVLIREKKHARGVESCFVI
jgi:hypothetical protein